MALMTNVAVLRREELQWLNGKLTGEASDHPGFAVRRLYDDACDEGVAVPRLDGRLVPFALTNVLKDRDGELFAWQFESPEGHLMTIFND